MGVSILLLSKSEVINFLPVIYFIIFILSNIIIYDKNDLVRAYFCPTSIMVLYVSFFFSMGTFALKYKLVLPGYENYYAFENINILSFYFICAICITLITQRFTKHLFRQTQQVKTVIPVIKQWNAKRLLLLLSILLIILTVSVRIPLPGGTGHFSSNFYMFAAIYISYIIKTIHHKFRLAIYGLLACLLALFFYEDRRLLFYYGFIICFIEVFDKYPYKIQLKNIIIAGVVIIGLIISNIAMSIHRGVGHFESQKLTEAFFYVDDYLKSDWAKTMLLHNFEGPGTTFHSYNAVDYIVQTGNYKYGLTMAKFFFLPVPRNLFPEKPQSMVHDYTAFYYPKYRAIGGSYVPNFYSEVFWNFGFMGLVFIFVIFYCFDSLYYKWILQLRHRVEIKNAYFLSSFAFLHFLFRGSGFDLYGLFVIIFWLMSRFYRYFEISPVKARKMSRFLNRGSHTIRQNRTTRLWPDTNIRHNKIDTRL